MIYLDLVLYPNYPVMPEPGGPGGPLAPPIFFRSVNLIRNGEGRLSPPITTGPPNVFFTFRHHCYLFIQFINSFLLHDYENRKTNKYIIVSGKLNLAYLIPNLHSAFNDSFYSISIL